MRLPPPITSRSNPRVKALRAAMSGKASRPGELTAIEGEHLLLEAASAWIQLETLFVREGSELLLNAPWARNLRLSDTVVLSQEVFDSAMDTATPQGVAATLRIPEAGASNLAGDGPVLLLENVQDPGNVGTLIRSAAAFGACAVLLTGDCANPWSPKVVRASAGSLFRVPVLRKELAEAVNMVRAGRQVLAAVVNEAGSQLPMQAQLGRGVLMVGNEGRGLTPQALALADERIKIPCRIESLNAAVAGSLLLYEAYRQGLGATPDQVDPAVSRLSGMVVHEPV